MDDQTVRELSSAPYLAAPEPLKLLAVGLNRNHVGTRALPKVPESFYKPITCNGGGPKAPIRSDWGRIW